MMSGMIFTAFQPRFARY